MTNPTTILLSLLPSCPTSIIPMATPFLLSVMASICQAVIYFGPGNMYFIGQQSENICRACRRPTARRLHDEVLERRGGGVSPFRLQLSLPQPPFPFSESTKSPPAPPHASSIACALPPALSQEEETNVAVPSVAAPPAFAARSPSTFILSAGAAALAARGAKHARSSSPQLPYGVRGELRL